MIWSFRPRPHVKYTRAVYTYITGSDFYVNPTWPSYKPITIIELCTNWYLLRGGCYNLYMLLRSECNRPAVWRRLCIDLHTIGGNCDERRGGGLKGWRDRQNKLWCISITTYEANSAYQTSMIGELIQFLNMNLLGPENLCYWRRPREDF